MKKSESHPKFLYADRAMRAMAEVARQAFQGGGQFQRMIDEGKLPDDSSVEQMAHNLEAAGSIFELEKVFWTHYYAMAAAAGDPSVRDEMGG